MANEGSSATRRSSAKASSVRVYVECGVTIAVTDDPPQYVKITIGQERIAANGTNEAVERAERMAYSSCEELIEKRLVTLTRMARRVKAGE